MRERKRTDCPICGAKGTMEVQKEITQKLEIAGGYPALTVTGLDAQLCSSCGDGFLSNKSQRKIASLAGRHMAEEDAKRTVASELAGIGEAAETLLVSRQAVYKMMDDGRLRYVFVAGQRLPTRKALTEAKARAKRFAKAPIREERKVTSRTIRPAASSR